MPANLTPEYRAAEEAFRKARDPQERLERLREMLRTIPKHKGTDHLQGDIKRRIKEMSEELERPARGGARGGPPLSIRPEGTRQLALLGPPNVGKSSLHARLTGSGAHAAAYPFTTRYPEPGMMRYEDIAFQLVDLPALAPEQAVSWLATALETADAALPASRGLAATSPGWGCLRRRSGGSACNFSRSSPQLLGVSPSLATPASQASRSS